MPMGESCMAKPSVRGLEDCTMQYAKPFSLKSLCCASDCCSKAVYVGSVSKSGFSASKRLTWRALMWEGW